MELHELYDIADENHIDVEYFPLQQLISLSTPDAIAINVDKIETESAEKFVLGHELGHCMTGSFYRINSLETRDRMETRANRWAIRNLLPWPELQEAIGAGIAEPWELAEYFNLPEPFIKDAIEYYINICGKKFDLN